MGEPALQFWGAALRCHWLPRLMRLVYYCCGIMIRSDRFRSLCFGCQIDYVTQTWDDGVADASRSAQILVNGCYLPHLVTLQRRTHTNTQNILCKLLLIFNVIVHFTCHVTINAKKNMQFNHFQCYMRPMFWLRNVEVTMACRNDDNICFWRRGSNNSIRRALYFQYLTASPH